MAVELGACSLMAPLAYTREHEGRLLHVATQGANIRALNLYMQSGFKITDSSVWYYYTRDSETR